MHDHPLTVAWNALLSGCKLWAVLPPDVDESRLLLDCNWSREGSTCTDDEGDDSDFDLSALEWFSRCSDSNDTNLYCRFIVQRPGEVVFIPGGWWHCVLNISERGSSSGGSVALSHSLALRRDLLKVLPSLAESDPDFAQHWIQNLPEDLLLDSMTHEKLISILQGIPKTAVN